MQQYGAYASGKGVIGMLQRLRYLWVFLITTAAAVLLHSLSIALPCPAVEVLTPLNESPWELGKLVFWPYLAGALLLWRLEPSGGSRGGHCAALLASTVLMVLLSRLLWGIAPVYALFSGAVIGGMALYHYLLRSHLPDSELLWYLLAILLGVAYLLLTALSPEGGIFLDPQDAAAMVPIPF